MPFGAFPPPIDSRSWTHSPARRCAICEDLEFESSISKLEFWLCPKCSKFFREYMLARMKEKETTKYHPMKHHD